MINQPTLGENQFQADWVRARSRPLSTTAGYGGGKPLTPKTAADAVVTALISPFVNRMRRSAVRAMNLATGQVLEVGVGRGGGLAHYRPGVDVTGTDEDHTRLGEARKVVAARALDNVSGLYKCQANRLRFADNAFDAVTAFFVLRLGRKPRDVVRELVRVTRPGGRVVVVDRFARTAARQAEEAGPRTPRRRHTLSRASRVRLGRWLAAVGIGPSTPKHVLTANAKLELISERTLGPFGMMQVLEFARRA